MTAALYKSEAEIAKLVGLPVVLWKDTATVLERDGLPQKDPVFDNRRYWPAVQAWLDHRAGLRQDAPPLAPDGEENFDYEPSKRRARA